MAVLRYEIAIETLGDSRVTEVLGTEHRVRLAAEGPRGRVYEVEEGGWFAIVDGDFLTADNEEALELIESLR